MDNNLIRTDMLNIADMVAREKGISKDVILDVLEDAMQKAAQLRYGAENDIRVIIDKKDGSIQLYKFTEIVANEDDVENQVRQIEIDEIKDEYPDLKVGDFIKDPLPPIDFGRIGSQAAKQVIIQKIREVEREKQYEDYKDKIGTIVSVIVKRIEYGNLIIDLGDSETVLRRNEIIPRERLKRGDRLRVYIYDVRRENRGAQVLISRTHPDFLIQLFKQEVPEIYEGLIDIVKVVRDPGSRAKMIVTTHDSTIDAVGACVGMRGARVQAVIGELQGEKIDIIPYIEDVGMLVSYSLKPAVVNKCILDEESNKVEVIVSEDELSLAIGRRGQNVRLASQLTGFYIDVLTKEQENERRHEEYNKRANVFIEKLNIDDILARLLASEGFSSVFEIADVPMEDLYSIEGINEELAGELKTRAGECVEEENKKLEKELSQLKIEKDLQEFLGENKAALVTLAKADILNLENLADLSSDELKEILEVHGITEEESSEFIMAARESAGWFDDENSEDDKEENEDNGEIDQREDENSYDDKEENENNEKEK